MEVKVDEFLLPAQGRIKIPASMLRPERTFLELARRMVTSLVTTAEAYSG